MFENLPTAATAATLAAAGEYEKAQKQSESIQADILAAIRLGKCDVIVAEALEPPVEAALLGWGYKCQFTADQRDGDYTTISW